MKFLIAFTVVIASIQALGSARHIEMECMTQFPTTSFQVRTQGNLVEVLVFHHNGMKYAPVINGVYTPNDLVLLGERAALVEKLAPSMVFRWDIAKCSVFPDKTFQCFGSQEVQDINGLKVNAYSIYSAKNVKSALGFVFTSTEMSLNLSVDGKNLDIQMPYHGQYECLTQKME